MVYRASEWMFNRLIIQLVIIGFYRWNDSQYINHYQSLLTTNNPILITGPSAINHYQSLLTTINPILITITINPI